MLKDLVIWSATSYLNVWMKIGECRKCVQPKAVEWPWVWENPKSRGIMLHVNWSVVGVCLCEIKCHLQPKLWHWRAIQEVKEAVWWMKGCHWSVTMTTAVKYRASCKSAKKCNFCLVCFADGSGDAIPAASWGCDCRSLVSPLLNVGCTLSEPVCDVNVSFNLTFNTIFTWPLFYIYWHLLRSCFHCL